MQSEKKSTPVLARVVQVLWFVCLLTLLLWPHDRSTAGLLVVAAVFGVLSLAVWFVALRKIAGYCAQRSQEEQKRWRALGQGFTVMAAFAALGFVIGAAIGGDSMPTSAAMSLLVVGVLVLGLGLIPFFRMKPGWPKDDRFASALGKGLSVVGIGFGCFGVFFGGGISPRGLVDPLHVALAVALALLAVGVTVLGLRIPMPESSSSEETESS